MFSFMVQMHPWPLYILYMCVCLWLSCSSIWWSHHSPWPSSPGTLWHPVCATLWHTMPWADFGVVRATGQIIGLIVPATWELWISEEPSEAYWAEWEQRCFHALLKCSHPWEEHSSSHWQDHQQHFLFQVHLCPQLGQHKHNIVSAMCSVPPRRDFLHHRYTKSINLFLHHQH